MASRPSRVLAAVVFLGVAAVSLAACSSSSAANAGSASSSSSASGSASGSASPGKPPNQCLLTIKQVSKAIVGKWKITSKTVNSCIYRSSQGVAFGTHVVASSQLKAGLKAARAACTTQPQNVSKTKSFACVVSGGSSTQIVGSVIARGHLWEVVIIPPTKGPYRPEIKAMKAILAHVRV